MAKRLQLITVVPKIMKYAIFFIDLNTYLPEIEYQKDILMHKIEYIKQRNNHY